ncbi:MAG: pilin [Patescibacteria group bacterium]
MNKKLIKHATSYLLLLVLFAPVMVGAVTIDDYDTGVGNVRLAEGDTTASITGTVVNIINIVLGLLGLVAVIIILIGGFKWMTAQGSEDRVKEAQKTIKYGLIGLAVILLAYVVVRFVISAVLTFGGDPDNVNPLI